MTLLMNRPADDDITTEQSLIAISRQIQGRLERNEPLSSRHLVALADAHGFATAAGQPMRQLYEAVEAALIKMVQRPILSAKPLSMQEAKSRLARLSQMIASMPTHTMRDDLQIQMQQFSTPLPLAWLVAQAGDIQCHDIVLEPSAGTGLLAAFVPGHDRLILNEISTRRRFWLEHLFPAAERHCVDATRLHAHLQGQAQPNVILMNPPFARGKSGVVDTHAAARHVYAALTLLAANGRCVAILPEGFHAKGTQATNLAKLSALAAPIFNCKLPGNIFAKHGTTMPTRLIIFEKKKAARASPPISHSAATLQEAYQALACLPKRTQQLAATYQIPQTAKRRAVLSGNHSASVKLTQTADTPAACRQVCDANDAQNVEYDILHDPRQSSASVSGGLYTAYAISRINIQNASDHPSGLVESTAMASILMPIPTARPKLTKGVLRQQLLSAPQLEALIMDKTAFDHKLPGWFIHDPDSPTPNCASEDTPGAFQYRRGFFLGDGTGCGKGRQVASIILDQWLAGKRKALWISMSDKLIEDAKRDWAALGGLASDIVSLDRFKTGTPITMDQGILFTTYATLRVPGRNGKKSRLEQILDWLTPVFDGVITFDEAHAMGNVTGTQSARGHQKGSLQALAGLQLQQRVPDACCLYVSATGATVAANLAYADRLGLWGSLDAPFFNRSEFIAAMEDGGVSVMELVARDLKAQGLYMARALSFAGVEYEILEHHLSVQQVAIYDAYCAAFEVIHNNLDAALEKAGIVDAFANQQDVMAKAAAHSTFESMKQRFFGALLVSLKCPTVLHDMKDMLAAGHACVIQLVSTGESLLTKRLANLDDQQRANLDIDLTPRDNVLQYLEHSFPTQLFELVEQEDGTHRAIPTYDAQGQPLQSPEAVALRAEMLEALGALPPIPTALDQIIAHFGPDKVAEITGRSKRLIIDETGRQHLENRPASVNLLEAQAFMDDQKQILIFSQAGGTGRSYHASLDHQNQRRRIHYLLEPGWRADVAIQGLGRTHRTNQASAPLFKPITTNVKAEKRFTSTISRRLDTLGALTRGQRQTGGQGLFRPDDNLESSYAKEALFQWYKRLHKGQLKAIGFDIFCQKTGLKLTDKDGALLSELPPIQRWLNRLLALPIGMQNAIFGEYEDLLAARIEAAIEAGTYDRGIETIHADDIKIISNMLLRTDPQSGAQTYLTELQATETLRPRKFDELIDIMSVKDFYFNQNSKRAAIQTTAPDLYDDDGTSSKRISLERPFDRELLTLDQLEESNWIKCTRNEARIAWQNECNDKKANSRTRHYYLLTGLIMPLWKHIKQKNIRVKRMITKDGINLLGPQIDKTAATILKTQFAKSDEHQLSAAEIWEIVMDRDTDVQRAHGITFRASQVMGQTRFEVTGVPVTHWQLLKNLGLYVDIIQHRSRLFIPSNSYSRTILEHVMRHYPSDADSPSETCENDTIDADYFASMARRALNPVHQKTPASAVR
jgi:hypothetical protein